MIAITVKQVLIAGRWIIANVGWCHFGGGKYDQVGIPTSLCTLLAVDYVNAPFSLKDAAHDVLRAMIKEHYPNPVKVPVYRSISGWNDRSNRTKEQVLDLYDKAIASLP